MSTSAPVSAEPLTVSRSPRMQTIFEFLRIVRNSESTVLVIGESGTGKEVIARMIHHASRRKDHPFVAVSCALFSETLIESELFGHDRGAFTGALRDRPGRFELANAARCSSTTSTTCRSRCRSSCCARCRRGQSSGSAGRRRWLSTSG
jgi:transcriptional regulator with GAF, ATPase, and Fis domain